MMLLCWSDPTLRYLKPCPLDTNIIFQVGKLVSPSDQQSRNKTDKHCIHSNIKIFILGEVEVQ